MPRPSRRGQLVDTALENFIQRGIDATSVADVASEVGVSKAAVTYHFPAKTDLVEAVAEPLVAALELLLPEPGEEPAWPDGVRALVEAYLDTLLRHRDVAEWLDSDRSALRGTPLGKRLRANHAAMRRSLAGRAEDDRARIAATVALGALWRPVRNVAPDVVDTHRDLIVESALAPLRVVR